MSDVSVILILIHRIPIPGYVYLLFAKINLCTIFTCLFTSCNLDTAFSQSFPNRRCVLKFMNHLISVRRK